MHQMIKLALLIGLSSIATPILADETLPSVETGPGFDCTEAKTKVEKRICDNAELSALDQKLSEVYAEAQAETAGIDGETGERIDPLAKEQKIWLRTRNQCKSNACLHSTYIKRIKYIETHWLHR
jgi:uncharacterized protein